MVGYTYEELADMQPSSGEAKWTEPEERRLCEQRFETRRVPSQPAFNSVDRRLQEKDSFAISSCNAGRSQNVRTQEMEERVFGRIVETLSTSLRAVTYEVVISQKRREVFYTRNACTYTTYKRCNVYTR